MTQERTIERICPQCGESYGEEHEFCPDDGTRLRDFTIRANAVEDPLLGSEIDGRFSVERVLGEGGMGKVYFGKQLSVHRDVAIKVLHSKLAGDQKLVKRFFREAQVISQFSHPNIVGLVDFGQDMEHDVLYLAMEFIDGTELGDLIDGYSLHPALATEIVIQACDGLSEPHSTGVVHRDLKPENLMLLARSDGRIQAKVVDFGIAHALQTETRLTQTGSVFGTAHYMAPEQASGGEVGAFTDVYAMGCILFELLTGHVPFDGDTAMQLLMAHVQEEPPLLTQFLPPSDEVDELSELIYSMMKKDPQDRPDSVLAVRDRLEQIQRKYNHPSLRADRNASKDQMFSKWLFPPASPGATGATVNRATNAPMSAYQTGDHGVPATSDTLVSGHTDQEMAFGSTQAMSTTGEQAAATGTAQVQATAPQVEHPDRATMSTAAIAAQFNDGRSKKILFMVGGALILVLTLAVAVLATTLGGDGGDDPAEDQMVAIDDDQPVEEEAPASPEDDDEPVDDEELADDQEGQEEEDEELAADEDEEEAEEEQASEPVAEPEPAPTRPRPTRPARPTRQVETQQQEEPRPTRPTRPTRPEPEEPPQPAEPDKPDDDDSSSRSPSLDIFGM